MFDVRLITDDTAAYKGYISRDIYKGFLSTANRYLLAAYDEGRTVGVCVFDASTVTRIVDIGITADCRDRNVLRRDFLLSMLGICENLHAQVLTISLYDEDGFEEWEQVLDEFRFGLDETTMFYRFKISDLRDLPISAKQDKSDRIIMLEQANAKQIEEIDKRLKEGEMFADLTHERIRRDLSSALIKNGKIDGVLLVSDIPGGICVEYAYVDSKESFMLVSMIRRTIDAIAHDASIPSDAVGELACIGGSSNKLFLKLFPECELLGEQRTYYTAII
ncbi:hypothetical protein SAMN02910292_02646 [Lachnospiraceae bacterium XBB2008]|nr:hypothetical protein SAMN02910292_02646 [Lachnospiraceae bacterium XBB2008]